MRDVDIVVLSKFPEIFEGFRASIKNECEGGIVVWDNPSASHPCGAGWVNVNVHRPFQMAANGNAGLRYAGSNDVLYAGDDTRIIEPDTIKRLQALAYSDPAIGILSPSVQGICTMHPAPTKDLPLSFVPWVGFVFVYIKREVIENVGYLDERYKGYGWDDLDYCVRVRQDGFKIAVARDITIKHGVNGHSYGSTFIPVRGEEQMGKDTLANMKRFAWKFGIENSAEKIFKFIEEVNDAECSQGGW